MRIRASLDFAVGVLLLALCTAEAAQAVDVIVGAAPATVEQNDQFDVEISIDAGPNVLGSYFFQLTYDPTVLHVVAIAGGASPEFGAGPITNGATFASGTTPFAAAQGSPLTPSGNVSIAVVTLVAVGPPGALSDLGVDVISLFDAKGHALPASVFSTLVGPIGFDAAGDPDGDGLTNQEEFDAGTFFYDDDSDDDNLSDFFEVRGGLDPRSGFGDDGTLGDPDGDLLTNIEEQGYGTNPTSADSDDDGLPDKYEVDNNLDPTDDGSGDPDNGASGDPDGDGRDNLTEFDVGSDPQDGRSVPVNIQLSLLPGLNSVAFPLDPPPAFSAFDLLASLDGGQHVVESIEAQPVPGELVIKASLDPNGLPEGDDFPIEVGQGTFVTATGSRSVAFRAPVTCPEIDLAAGPNLIGFRCIPTGYTAFLLLTDLGGPTVVASVQRFNRVLGSFETATFDQGIPAGADFPIREGQAYILSMLVPVDRFDPMP